MDLKGLFAQLSLNRNDDVLVGTETMDDAGVFRLNDEQALVVTADFITPFTDDPFLFGQVAAANSISDVYAMGGRAVTVLNLCCFPTKGVSGAILEQILQGGLDKTHEAGAVLIGGHTIQDDEMKYGLAVNGIVHPGRYTANSGARKEDVFILTKPIGTGVYIGAGRGNKITPEELAEVGQVMARLNKTASETMMEFDARGATDITGFGLGGHTLSMARASKISIRFRYDAIPRFPKTLDLIDRGIKTRLTPANAELIADGTTYRAKLSDVEKGLFVDPQTSGGLFFGVNRKDADACLRALHERGVKEAAIVAEAVGTDRPGLEVVRD